MSLLDIKGGFEGFKEVLHRAFGERAAEVIEDLGVRGGESFMEHALVRGILSPGAAAVEGALEAYTTAGFGRFRARELDWAGGWAVIDAEEAFEGWAAREIHGVGTECRCDYSRGALTAFVREASRAAAPPWFDQLVGVETRCLARGDGSCTFVIGPRERLAAVGHRVPERPRVGEAAGEALEDLRERERLYRQLTEDVLDGIYVLDRDGVVLYCNRAAEHLLEMPRDRIQGANYATFIHPSDLPRVASLVADLQSGRLREIERFEARMVTGAGAIREFEMNARGTYDADGHLVRIEGVGRDLTPRKQLEAQLVSAERFAAIGKMSAEIAHEINNPLAVIKTSLSVVAGEPDLGEAARECLAGAMEEIDRAAEILREVLNFYQPARDPESADCDVNAAVRSLAALVRHSLEVRGISLHLDLDAGEPHARCPTSAFKQVLMNLLLNARDAVASGGRVAVRTETDPRGLVLVVEDDGHGIPATDVARIFEPYFTTKEPGVGTGLGLTVVQGILRRCAGGIEVATAEGQGSRFTVHLPLP
ncbi:MAG: PAS domain S-box protein [Myxococcales bacterium]|nr:PAS domain S-box protein [Myxococcales bacterium]